MLLNPIALEVARACGSDSPHVQGLLIEADGSTVATDGHILFKFTPSPNGDPKEYPVFDGINPVDGKEKLHEFVLSQGSARAILRVLPKEKRLPQPILKNIVLDVGQTNKNGHAVIGFTDFNRPTIFRPEKVKEKFPDYHKVFPKGKGKFKIAFTTNVLRKALEVVNSLEIESFTLVFRGPKDPVEIVSATPAGKVLGLVMPCRADVEPESPKPKPKDKPKKKVPDGKK